MSSSSRWKILLFIGALLGVGVLLALTLAPTVVSPERDARGADANPALSAHVGQVAPVPDEPGEATAEVAATDTGSEAITNSNASGANSSTVPGSLPAPVGEAVRLSEAPAERAGPARPDAGAMARIEAARRLLESLVGDLDAPLDDTVRARLRQDVAYREWMLTLEGQLGAALPARAREALQERQLRTVNLRDQLQDAYLAGDLDWQTYVDGLKAVTLWSDEQLQRHLTAEQYTAVNGFNKAELDQVNEDTWVPPEQLEALTLFPDVRNQMPDITEAELHQIVPPARLAEVSTLQKSLLREQMRLARELDAGTLQEDAFMAAVGQAEQRMRLEARTLLTDQAYQLLFPEPPVDAGTE